MRLKLALRILLLFLIPSIFMNTDCGNDLQPGQNIDQYFKWQITGVGNGQIQEPPDLLSVSYTANFTAFGGLASSAGNSFNINFQGPQVPGTYPLLGFTLFTGNKYYVKTGAPLTFTITSYGAVGDYILGTYSGTVKDSASTQTYTIGGDFRLRNQP